MAQGDKRSDRLACAEQTGSAKPHAFNCQHFCAPPITTTLLQCCDMLPSPSRTPSTPVLNKEGTGSCLYLWDFPAKHSCAEEHQGQGNQNITALAECGRKLCPKEQLKTSHAASTTQHTCKLVCAWQQTRTTYRCQGSYHLGHVFLLNTVEGAGGMQCIVCCICSFWPVEVGCEHAMQTACELMLTAI